jgi:short-subunit dehydrogenase
MQKVSIISGGSSGLGLSIAEKLLKEGKNVIILGRDPEKLINAAEWLQTGLEGPGIYHFVCNIAKDEDIRKLGSYIQSQNFSVEFLYNNAGRGLDLRSEKTTGELIDKVFEPNLKGMILLTAEILRITPPDEELTIVNIMSTSALTGRANETVYCAAKWGARGFTEALRTELKGEKRNIIAIYPGGMKTAFWKVADVNRDISRFMDPDEVASRIVNAILYSDHSIVSDITINRKP